jgi:hypothetical protein
VNDCDQASDKNNVFHACSDGNDFNAKVSRDKNQDLFRGAGVGKSTWPFDIHTIAKYLCTTSLRHAVIQGTKTLTSESRF